MLAILKSQFPSTRNFTLSTELSILIFEFTHSRKRIKKSMMHNVKMLATLTAKLWV